MKTEFIGIVDVRQIRGRLLIPDLDGSLPLTEGYRTGEWDCPFLMESKARKRGVSIGYMLRKHGYDTKKVRVTIEEVE